jgi:hypothetical protein
MTSVSSNLLGRFFSCAAFAILLALAAPGSPRAQSATPAPAQKVEKTPRPDVRLDPTAEKSGSAKSVTAKRQKLRDCGAKWRDENKAEGLTGRTAYLKFLSNCLKS